MTKSTPRVSGPLRRHANIVIFVFFAVHVALVMRATLPLPGKLHGPWPWRMFERRPSWERVLVATGIDPNGERHRLPLEKIFRYARGTTRLYAYHQIDALSDPAAAPAQSAFAAVIARRAAELGFEPRAIELKWIVTDLDNGQSQERLVGIFNVGAAR
jgi:hypothetical protein